MNWLKILVKVKILIVALWISGCGVKGDPLPPDRPPDLGRGRPTYKRAAESLKIEKSPRVKDEDEDEDEDDKRNGE
jgi:hypothetical protein